MYVLHFHQVVSYIVYGDQIFSEVTTETLGTQYDIKLQSIVNLGQFLDNVEC